jgi:hypothetical protein
MKTLEEIRGAVTTEPEFLEERFLRKGAGLIYARQSKKHGDAASRHFSDSTQHLNRPADTVEDQLQNITNAMKEMNDGFVRLRDQNGSITALCLVSVLLSEKGRR